MMNPINPTIKGRGAAHNPPNRFESCHFEPDPEVPDDEQAPPQTVYYRDSSKTIIASNDSPDVPFTFSINPYRGCTHGCCYCFARPGHEYLGWSAGLDFETKILFKPNAPILLREEFLSPRYKPAVLAISGVTDCYQPVERRLQLTRRCLEICAEFRNPVSVITKNLLITRDADVLQQLAQNHASMAMISVTTLDQNLSRVMEPRTSTPKRRLAAIEALAKAGVPVGVMVAPVIPGLTDSEVPTILKAAASAGAKFAGFVPLRLPGAVAPLFADWLDRHFPDRKEKILNRIRTLRGGKLNDPNFGSRMQGGGIFSEQISTMFKLAAKRTGLDAPAPQLSTDAFQRPGDGQMLLFPTTGY